MSMRCCSASTAHPTAQDGDGQPGVLRGVLERLPYPMALDLAALAGRLYHAQLADLSAWFAERISSQVRAIPFQQVHCLSAAYRGRLLCYLAFLCQGVFIPTARQRDWAPVSGPASAPTLSPSLSCWAGLTMTLRTQGLNFVQEAFGFLADRLNSGAVEQPGAGAGLMVRLYALCNA